MVEVSVRETNPTVRTVTLVEDVTREEYHRIAGADEVLSPRQILGENLVRRIPSATTEIDTGVEIGPDLKLVELSVESESALSGRTAAEARLHERYGVNVIGAWIDGSFEAPSNRPSN